MYIYHKWRRDSRELAHKPKVTDLHTLDTTWYKKIRNKEKKNVGA